MAFPNSLFLVILFSFLSLLPSTQSRLSTDYYNKRCPQFDNIMQRIIADKQLSAPTTAAAILRVFFHDCVVNGCDASILIASNAFNKSELDADTNLSLAGDAFDLIVRAKTAVELQCPGVVSCSDILARSARDLVVMVGGPFYEVLLGRKDSKVSDPSMVESNLPKATSPMSQILSLLGQRIFGGRNGCSLRCTYHWFLPIVKSLPIEYSTSVRLLSMTLPIILHLHKV